MSIEDNTAARKTAEQLHATIGELLRDEVPKLPSGRAREIFWRLMLASVQKNLPQDQAVEALKEREKKKKQGPPTSSASYDEAMSLASEIEDLVLSICDAGQEFADSVGEKTASIMESVERSGGATDGQLQALENMLEGLQRWFHD